MTPQLRMAAPEIPRTSQILARVKPLPHLVELTNRVFSSPAFLAKSRPAKRETGKAGRQGALIVDMDSNRTGIDDDKSSWLNDTLRQFNFVAVMRERVQIRRACSHSLKLYRQIAAEMPQASKMELYAQVVKRRGEHDDAAVREILRHAEESFAQWPVDRDLTFRDLVAYLAVTDCMRANPGSKGVRSEVIGVVADAIPAEL